MRRCDTKLSNKLGGRGLYLILLVIIFSLGFVSPTSWLSNFENRVNLSVRNINNSYVTYYQNDYSFDSSEINFNKLTSENQIVMTDSDGVTKSIPFYVDYFNQSEGILNITFQIPILEPLETRSVYLYYNNQTENSFYVPPLGNFQKFEDNPQLDETLQRLPENMVWDNETNLYWICTGQTSRLVSSPDLETWTDRNHIPTGIPSAGHSCFLMKYNNTWYFYRQRNVSTSSQVNGTYTPSLNNPMWELGEDGEWDDDNNGEEVSVFQYNGTWYMFYMGDQGSKVEQIGYLTGNSPEGPWTKYSGNPVLTWGDSGSYDAGTVADPFVYILNNLTYVFYAVSSKASRPWISAYSLTNDFVNFFKRNIVLGTGDDGAFDAGNAHRGGITLVSDWYYFPYTGWNESKEQFNFGMAKQYAKNTLKGYPPEQVYDLYDDFSKDYLQSQWRFRGGTSKEYTINNEKINLTSGEKTVNNMLAIQQFNSGIFLESKFRLYNLTNSTYFGVGLGNENSLLSNSNVSRVNNSFAEGNLSKALNTSETYGKVPFSQSLNLSSQMTIEAFIYPYDNTTDYQGIVSRRQYNSTPSANYILWLCGDEIRFGFSSSGVFKYHTTTSANLNKNTWYHVVAQFDTNTDRVTIYINGKLVLNVTQSSEPTTFIDTPLKIGYGNYLNQYFNGLIDELRISNITRYSENFTVPSTEFSPDTNTMALYHFNFDSQDFGYSFDDSSFNSNKGSLIDSNDGSVILGMKEFIGCRSDELSGKFVFSNSDGLGNYNLEESGQVLDEQEHLLKMRWINSSLISYKLDEGNWINNTQQIYESKTLNPIFIVGSNFGNTTLEIDYIKIIQENEVIKPVVSFINSQTFSSDSAIEEPTTTPISGGFATYYPTQEQMQEGYSKSLRKNWKVRFIINEETHTAAVNSVDSENKTVEVKLEEKNKTFEIQENQTKKIDLDDDGYYDLQIWVKEVRSNGYADLEFREIHEEIPAEEQEKQQEPSKFEIKSWMWIVWGVISLLIIGMIIRKLLKKEVIL